jgi:phosphate transport system substrate-binding protein
MRCTAAVTVAILLLAASTAEEARAEQRSPFPTYRSSGPVRGSIRTVGSDTMNSLMTLWGEAFMGRHPGVKIEIEGKGSNTAPPALISGSCTFGLMSRPMRDREIAVFRRRYGHDPVAVPAAIDMLAIYVHRDNPIPGLTMPQVDAIFSSTRKLGHPEIRTWGDVGLDGTWASREIRLCGRNQASGTYAYLRKHALGKGEYRSEVRKLPSSSAVVQTVSLETTSIGYSGIGYRKPGVRPVPLAGEAGEAFVEPVLENADRYPLSRRLYIYVNHVPVKPLAKIQAEFLRFVLSRQGQEIVGKAGFVAAKPAWVKEARNALELD